MNGNQMKNLFLMGLALAIVGCFKKQAPKSPASQIIFSRAPGQWQPAKADSTVKVYVVYRAPDKSKGSPAASYKLVGKVHSTNVLVGRVVSKSIRSDGRSPSTFLMTFKQGRVQVGGQFCALKGNQKTSRTARCNACVDNKNNPEVALEIEDDGKNLLCKSQTSSPCASAFSMPVPGGVLQ
jgi:hypothetical protein